MGFIRRTYFTWVAAMLVLPGRVGAQGAGKKPIQDNSFLVEEAYNQETGVVQHIGTFQRVRGAKDWSASFTQEWPAPTIKHQLSYTIPIVRDPSRSTTVGDVALNYRYQLVGSGDARLAASPRLSVLLPTGSVSHGSGSGATGIQAVVPISFALTPALVSHSDVGITVTPRTRNGAGERAAGGNGILAQSLVWLVHPNFNVLVETVYTRSREVIGAGRTTSVSDWLVSPGIRAAKNFSSGLQIVPGIAFPIGVSGAGKNERSVFLYLSFEHPFRDAR